MEWEKGELVVVVMPVAVVMVVVWEVGVEGPPVVPGEDDGLERAVAVARCINYIM